MSKLRRKCKAVYNKSSNIKRVEAETGINLGKKENNDNQIYFQQNNKKIFLDALHQYYEDNIDLSKIKSRK